MRTTLIIDDELIDRARKLTGIEEKTHLVHKGLYALIERESARRLALMEGSMPYLKVPARKRPARTKK
jgi:Arc/MetJ family transcription regulator